MNDPSALTFDEALWLIILIGLMAASLVWGNLNRNQLALLQPPVILVAVFFYYTVAGPLNALSSGNWFDRGTNLRDSYEIAWQGATVSLAAFWFGYARLRQRLPAPRRRSSFYPQEARRLGNTLCVIAIVLFALVSGPRVIAYLNPLTAREADLNVAGLELGAFANYAGLSINLLIPGLLLQLAAWIAERTNPAPILLWLVAAAGIFTSLGFRWRLITLFGAMMLLWFLSRRRNPNLLVVIPSVLTMVWLAGLIGLTRSYGKGLDLTDIEGLTATDIFFAGFGESGIFLTSGGVMNLVPQSIGYVGITPLINTVLFPIPSAWLPLKNSADYIFNATAVLYGSDIHNSGSAFLNYAEFFLMAGWPGVIAGYVILGWLYQRLWLWYVQRYNEPLAQVTYVCAVSYLVVVVSRGYLPQVTSLFAFTVLPLFILYYRTARPIVPMVNSTNLPSADLPSAAQQR